MTSASHTPRAAALLAGALLALLAPLGSRPAAAVAPAPIEEAPAAPEVPARPAASPGSAERPDPVDPEPPPAPDPAPAPGPEREVGPLIRAARAGAPGTVDGEALREQLLRAFEPGAGAFGASVAPAAARRGAPTAAAASGPPGGADPTEVRRARSAAWRVRTGIVAIAVLAMLGAWLRLREREAA